MRKEINSVIVSLLYFIMFFLLLSLFIVAFASVYIDLTNSLSILYDISISQCNDIFCYGISFILALLLAFCAILRVFYFFGKSEKFRLKEEPEPKEFESA